MINVPCAIFDDFRQRAAVPSATTPHLPFLLDMVQQRPMARVAELGTGSGDSTSALLLGVHLARGYVWSVDSGQVDVPEWWTTSGLWSFLAADDLSPAAHAWLPAGLDVLFIDTIRQLDHTLGELRTYGPRVARGGVILVHGTQWDEVLLPSPTGPVAKALDIFIAETGLSWQNVPGGEGLGVIRL
jgi:predicted O-methyltransferase YrrM